MLKKILLSKEEKEVLEKLADCQIYQRNVFEDNTEAIEHLQKQGLHNAQVYLERNRLGQRLSIFEENNLFTTVIEIQKKLGLKEPPRRMECYDISHLSGTFVYGSMVVFTDGKPSKSAYKLFKTKWQNNDFENHKNVLTRRFQRALDWELSHTDSDPLNPWELPNLIIVDGGKGQLSGDLEVLDEFKKKFTESGLTFDVEICSLAKREEEVFLPYNSTPVILSGQALFMVQRIRDEAHRFAITNNRKAKLKTASKSQLDDINGVGPKTKQKLLSVFGSTEQVIENIYKNPQILYELVGKSVFEKLKIHFGIKG